MRKIFYLLIITAAISNSYAQQTWSEQNSGLSIPLTCACAIDNDNGWICGFNGSVLRTVNHGQNWTNVSGNGIPTICHLITIWGIDQNNALTAGNVSSTTYLFRTTNAGASWTQVLTQDNGVYNAVWFTNSTNGFLEGDPVGNRWSLWRTSNGGANWDSSGLYLPQSGSDGGWSNSFYMFNNQVWFGTSNTRIYYSSNSGTSWTAQSSVSEILVQSITFDAVNGPSGLGFSGGSGLLKTTNGGVNWSSIGTVGSGFYVSLASVRFWPSAWLARGTSIYTSGNGGTNWNTEYTAPSGNYRNISQLRVAITSVWAVRDNGGISWRYFNPTGIKPISGEIPEKFSLYQNYPNPFNPATRIKFDVQSSPLSERGGGGFVKLIVYDILGREAATLVNQQLNPGTYEIEFDGSNLPSGIYFYRMTAGEYTETRKMILLK